MNPADGEPGSYLDEAAERQAFMDAVAEWRKADGDGAKQPLRIEREYITGPAEKNSGKASGKSAASSGTASSASLVGGASGGASDGMWKNPFAPASAANEDDNQVRVAFIWLAVDSMYFYDVSSFSAPSLLRLLLHTSLQIIPSSRASMHTVHTQDDNSGVLDEAAERKAFQEAVMEWRRGPTQPATSSSAGTSTKAGSKTASAGTTSSPTKAAQRAASKQAVDLNDSFGSDAAGMSPARQGGSGAQSGAGGGLYAGELNEEAEHAVRCCIDLLCADVLHSCISIANCKCTCMADRKCVLCAQSSFGYA